MKDRSQSDPAKKAIENNVCGICRSLGLPPPCKGHRKTGGKKEEKAGANQNAKNEHAQYQGNKLVLPTESQNQLDNETIQIKNSNVFKQRSKLNMGLFNADVISELLSKGLLLIDNNKRSSTLTIKCNPNISLDEKEELKKYIDAILHELDLFKKEQGISSNGLKMEKDYQGNIVSLSITLPPTKYDIFIQHLASVNLLPIQNIAQHENIVYKKGYNHFSQTPLPIKPTPSMNRGSQSDKEEEKSSIRKRSPLNMDKLTPKGYK